MPGMILRFRRCQDSFAYIYYAAASPHESIPCVEGNFAIQLIHDKL
jgi:hypothetical protein